MARARKSTSQCASPFGTVNAAGQVVSLLGHQLLVADARCDSILFGWVGGTNFAVAGRIIVSGAKS